MNNVYKRGYYRLLLSESLEVLKEEIRKEGFDPILIEDPPGKHYPQHSHVELKLLALVQGEMRVAVNGEEMLMKPGDKLVIPGMVEHEAWVGDTGCQFFWSEIVDKEANE